MIVVRTTLFLIIFANVEANFNAGLKFVEKIYDECQDSQYLLKCYKIQALKITNKILNLNKIKIIDGVSLVRRDDTNQTTSFWYPTWTTINFEQFDSKDIDQLLRQSVNAFVLSRKFDIQPPEINEEARKRGQKTHFGPLLAAIALKSGIMAVAFKGVVATAGVALLVGKMALLLCVIMSLKKLISEKEEKATTVEIIKHPTHSTSHTHSASFEDDHYHRSVASEEDLSIPEKMIYTYEPHDSHE
ncbi:hypothetical protein MML48_5g00010391 [Holotrichia oblita]|uniref:Uncharacterized protein n=2 Tax=Holotrichia oblita TaxID=644536 RepID=A0ACB9T4I6_HOLOL|nr:hypothetical protein MML48_5g00002977 [Holotrichia oblita]KAI4461716.1 hypothetical protein MML48_5g00010391 [Holotrichia oblita]